MQVAGVDLLGIAKKLATPYGISVSADGDVGAVIPQFNLMYGESPYEVIERICRYRGKIAYERPDGSLLIANSGSSKMASGIAEGKNVIAASAEYSMAQRFSNYRGFALPSELYNDSTGGSFALAGKPAVDAGVNRHRQRDIVVESISGYQDVVQKRISWEASWRQGQGFVVRATVDSWRDAEGELWKPNAIIPVALPTLRVPLITWTIGEVTFRRNENQGTTADLVIMPKSSFDPEPTLPPDAAYRDLPAEGPRP
jgi:prophage tail gpP-like protein